MVDLDIAEKDSTVCGVVLAGGQSRRFVRNKALAEVDGHALIERVVGVLERLFPQVILITNTPDAYAHLGLSMFSDIIPGLGPIGGIYTALVHLPTPYGFIVACDMPFLNLQLIRYQVSLREGYAIVAPRRDWRIEPLHTLYSRSCLKPFQEAVERGERQIIRFYDKVRVRYVDEEELRQWDPDCRSLANINTPEDIFPSPSQKKSPPGETLCCNLS